MSTYYVYVNGPQKLDESALTDSVFIAHDFFGGDERKKDDYRLPFRDAFSKRGYRTLFADEEAAPGTLLSTICQHIINTEIGIYDVTGYNANVLIELGLALGLNRPTLVIAKDDGKPLLGFLEELQPLRYTSYPNLARTVVDRLENRLHAATDGSISRTYCASCLHECRLARKRTFPAHEEYLVVGISEIVDEELNYNVQEAFLSFELKPCSDESPHPHTTCRWVYGLRRSQVALFHLREPYHGETNAPTNVQVGIAAGIGTPWTLVLPTKQHPPTDLRGLLYVNVGEYQSGFRKELSNSVRALISSRVNNPGIYPPLPTLDLDEPLEDDTSLVLSAATPAIVRILVADDHPDVQIRLQSLFLTQGWQTVPYESIAKDDPLTEYDMLVVDSTFAPLIAEFSEAKPSLLFTVKSPKEIIDTLSDVKPWGWLTKPATDDDVLDVVKRLLNGERLSVPDSFQAEEIVPDRLQSSPAKSHGKHVFIAYSNVDRDFARKIADGLLGFGIDVWIDDRIEIGERWWNAIDDAIRESAAFVVLMSPNSRTSEWVEREVLVAERMRIPFYPVLLDGSAWARFADIQHLDMSDSMTRDARITQFAQLLSRVVPAKVEMAPQQTSASTNRSAIDTQAERGSVLETVGNAARRLFGRQRNHVFISYRRADTLAIADRIYEAIVARFGREHTFRDIEAIRVGEDFRSEIQGALEQCNVLLAVIGRNWLGTTDENGSRRLDDPDDYVRIEIEVALVQDKRVIPILVDGARMPSSTQLPLSLSELAYRQAFTLRSGADFDADMKRLLSELARGR